MKLNLPVVSRLIIVVIIASVLLTFGLARNSSAIVPPCPVATDATIAQMAQQWAASFKTPYCAYLDKRRNILLKQKLVAGVLQQTSAMSEIFRVTEESTSIVKRIEKVARRIRGKAAGIEVGCRTDNIFPRRKAFYGWLPG